MKSNRIAPQEADFTKLLGSIAKSPKLLHYLGKLPTRRIPTVAIVGTRKPTSYGKEVTERTAYELASKGVCIISGLALGVDAIAHRGALEAKGTTIAVLGNGLPTIYPSTHRQLGEAIIQSGGALISEYPEGTPPLPFRFLERNRIVSGLADAIVITEAAQRSGSLNTAMHALDQGKEVFVVPGPITSPMSLGCNALLKQGASPLLSVDDVLEFLAIESKGSQTLLPLVTDPVEKAVMTFLHEGGRDGDAMQEQLNVSATELSTALTMLEINGFIRSLGASQWTIR